MNLPTLLLVCFPAIMAYAAFSDLFTMRLSNGVAGLLLALFFVMAALTGMPKEVLLMHLAAGFGVLVVSIAMFATGKIGGGDAKFAAVTAVWMGFEHLAEYSLGASLFGGILTLLILRFRRLPLPQFALNQAWIVRLHDKNVGVPYGIALAIAGVFFYPETRIFTDIVTG